MCGPAWDQRCCSHARAAALLWGEYGVCKAEDKGQGSIGCLTLTNWLTSVAGEVRGWAGGSKTSVVCLSILILTPHVGGKKVIDHSP